MTLQPSLHSPAAQWPLLLQEAMHVRLLALEDNQPAVVLAESLIVSSFEATLDEGSPDHQYTLEAPKDRAKRRRREDQASIPARSYPSMSPEAKLSRTPAAGKDPPSGIGIDVSLVNCNAWQALIARPPVHPKLKSRYFRHTRST